MFQKTVGDWEKYENEKTNMVQYLKKAEAELEKPPSTTGQDLAKKDYTSKKVSYIGVSKLCFFCKRSVYFCNIFSVFLNIYKIS